MTHRRYHVAHRESRAPAWRTQRLTRSKGRVLGGETVVFWSRHMPQPDPIRTAARDVLAQALADMRGSIDGATAEALNWRPGGDGTSSIAVLAVHALGSTRSWLARAMLAPLPKRDRDAEFAVTATDAAALRAVFDDLARDCTALLERGAPDWATICGHILARPDGENAWIARLDDLPSHPRVPGDELNEVTSAWALLHALEHLREHAAQMSLTRQLVERR
jgi:hypothetical protein